MNSTDNQGKVGGDLQQEYLPELWRVPGLIESPADSLTQSRLSATPYYSILQHVDTKPTFLDLNIEPSIL